MPHLRIGSTFFAIAALSLLLHGCSSRSSTSNNNADTDSVVQGDAASVLIPANSFTDDVTATITEGGVDVSALTNATSLSESVTISFDQSGLIESDDPMEVTVTLDPDTVASAIENNQTILAMVKMEDEDLSTEEDAAFDDEIADGTDSDIGDDRDWTFVVGELSTELDSIIVPLLSAADNVHIVAVATDALKVHVDSTALVNASLAAASSAKDIVPIENHSWAIYCDERSFGEESRILCDPNHENFILETIVTELDAAGQVFRDLGFQNINVQQVSLGTLNRANAQFAPQIEINADNENLVFNLAFFTRNGATSCQDNVRGCYSPATGKLELTPAALNAAQNEIAGSTIAHELFHAAQAALMPEIYGRPYRFLKEGTATAMGIWMHHNLSAANLLAHVRTRARDWRFPLNSNALADTAYENFEFFATIAGGNLNYFPTLFANFGQGDPYTQLDTALHASLGKSLPTLYMQELLPRKTPDRNHPYCVHQQISQHSTDFATVVQLRPMSSICSRFTFEALEYDENSEDFDPLDRYSCITIEANESLNSGKQYVLLHGAHDVIGTGIAFENSYGDLGYLVTADQSLTIMNSSTIDLHFVDVDMTRAADEAINWNIAIAVDESCGGGELTGTWCAFDDDLIGNDECSAASTKLHLIQNGNTITGWVDPADCPNEFRIIETATLEDDRLSLTLGDNAIGPAAGCSGNTAIHYDLSIFRRDIHGRYEYGNLGDFNVSLEKVSDDPLEMPFPF